MLNFLEACHYKVSCAVCQVEGRMEPHSKFKQYIERNKDKSVRFTMRQIKELNLLNNNLTQFVSRCGQVDD